MLHGMFSRKDSTQSLLKTDLTSLISMELTSGIFCITFAQGHLILLNDKLVRKELLGGAESYRILPSRVTMINIGSILKQ